ncbi:MAG: trypsin-like serine protease [Labilithrix sp.]|nr:trypsin-like serine protease [Labilithrix sp.]
MKRRGVAASRRRGLASRLGVAVAAALFAVAATARAELAPRILGGAPAPDVAAAVALRDGAGRLACSGVLVGPRAVLAAAHCFPPVDDASLLPRDACFGADVRSCRPVGVSGYVLHPGWDALAFTFDDDLAVVFLEDDAPARPASLAEASPSAGDEIDVVGYGRTDPSSTRSAGEKRSVRLPVLAIERGRILHGEGACRGDSGGPLFDARRPASVVAITSSGPAGCVDAGRATLVAPNRAFIDAAVAESEVSAAGGPSCALARGSRGDGSLVAVVLAALLAWRLRGAHPSGGRASRRLP